MEALKINEYVTDDGIKIGIEKLKNFRNRKVEIIILPLDNEESEKSIAPPLLTRLKVCGKTTILI